MENLEEIMDNITFVPGDICYKSDVDKAMTNCDAVVNFAAATHLDLDRSITEAGSHRTKVLGTHNWVEAQAKFRGCFERCLTTVYDE